MLKEIFTEIKSRHGITGKALSEATGISQKHISEYINGKRDVTSSTLWRMIEAMDELSPGAKKDFGCELAELWKPTDLKNLVAGMSIAQLNQLLFFVAETLEKIRLRDDATKKDIAVSSTD